MIDQAKIDKMEDRARDASFGNNTGMMWQHYATDVRALIKEREELLKLLQQANQANGDIMLKLAAAEEARATWQMAKARVVELEREVAFQMKPDGVKEDAKQEEGERVVMTNDAHDAY